MPELPDVEGFRRVGARAAGRRVTDVEVADAGVLRGVAPARLRRALTGTTFGTPRRYGKWLGIPTREHGRSHRQDEAVVAFHFGMTGALSWCRADEPRHEHDRLVVTTDSGELRYRDMRKLQGVRLADDDAAFEALLESLGPDAAAVRRDELAERVRGRRAGVKAVLMDQAVVAGLGNLTVDETLWRARIAPNRKASELTDAETARLHRAVASVLGQASKAGHVPDRRSWLTGHRDEDGGRCSRCRTRLRHGRVGGRGTVWCPRCQE